MKDPNSYSPGSRKALTRRSFLQLCGGASLALVAPAAAGAASRQERREIGKPTFTIKTVDGDAEKIYRCRGDLKRFSGGDMAFKKVPEELGLAFSRAFKENVVTNIEGSRIGHGVKVSSPARARAHMALDVAADTWNKIIGPYGENRDNEGLRSWLPLKVPEKMYTSPDPDPDPEELSHKMKVIATYVGADAVGITRLNRKWVYADKCVNSDSPEPPETKAIVFRETDQPEETDSELVIPESVTNAIVFVTVQPRMSTEIGPATFQTMASTSAGYSWSGLTAVALAEAVRFMGYVALPCMNETAMSVPLAVDAGLGQLGRLGYLITPWFGPHVRIAKVLTNMPLTPDTPIDFGVTEYCMNCGICAIECPSGAISPDIERSYAPLKAAGPCGNPGAYKWYINGKRCLKWWVESGAGCSRCTSVCPYTNLTLGSYLGEDPDPESFWSAEFGQYGHREVIY